MEQSPEYIFLRRHVEIQKSSWHFVNEQYQQCSLSFEKTYVFISDRRLFTIDDQTMLLSEEERNCARRFRKTMDQQLYRTAHILKRLVCADALGCTARNLIFNKDINGKPYLDNNTSTLFFNLSHSGIWSGIAVSRYAALGLDIQHPFNVDNFPLDTFIHPADCLKVNSQADAALIWAIKEACVKESGIGLSQPLNVLRLEATPLPFLKMVNTGEKIVYIRHIQLADQSALALAASDINAVRNIKFFQLVGLLEHKCG